MDSIWIQIKWRFVAYIGGGWVNSLHQAFSRFGWDFWSGWWWLREHQILHESLYRSECICATQKLVDWVMRCWRLITLTTYRNWILENNNGRERKRFPYSISFSNHAPLMLFAVCMKLANRNTLSLNCMRCAWGCVVDAVSLRRSLSTCTTQPLLWSSCIRSAWKNNYIAIERAHTMHTVIEAMHSTNGNGWQANSIEWNYTHFISSLASDSNRWPNVCVWLPTNRSFRSTISTHHQILLWRTFFSSIFYL